ncbi:MAG: DNA primase [Verrucomicrobiales bacterium]|nr:DNA primase [Verrucomicrobiales bacterium]
MAGLIPQNFIDDLISRADIVEVIGKRIQLKKAGREFKACCPFHDEKTPSFTVSPNKGFYHCFGCGAHGTVIGFLMDFEHISFVEAIENLAASMGIEIPHTEKHSTTQRYDELFILMEKVANYWQSNLKKTPSAIEYLKKRGIDGSTTKRFGIGYASNGWSHILDKFGKSEGAIKNLLATGLIISKDNNKYYDRFRDRIIFPIRDVRGRTIGFGGRAINNNEPKYLNSPETVLFHKGQELYGLYEARQALRNIDHLIVVEGYMDTLALAKSGIDSAVATLGTATSSEHLNRLFRLTENIFFSFDGDRAGQKAAWRALESTLPKICEGRQVRFIFLPKGSDPDSFINENGVDLFVKLMNTGIPLSEFLIKELSAKVDMHTIDGKAKLAEMARPLINKIPAGVYKELLVKSLAKTIGLTDRKLENMMLSHAKRDKSSQNLVSKNIKVGKKTAPSASPSIVRRAITLILNFPNVGINLDADKLTSLNRAGVDLLYSLIKTTQSEPSITTAGLLERWRNDKQGQHLGKLAATDLPINEEFNAAAELEECLEQLAIAGRKERIEFLIQKQRFDSLSEEERLELKKQN